MSLACLSTPQPITVYPWEVQPVETAIDLQLAILANAGTGVASRTPLNYRWIAQGLAQKNTPLTALVPDSNPVALQQTTPQCRR